MTWIVSTRTENPFGICFNADNGYEEIEYRPFTTLRDSQNGSIEIVVAPGGPWPTVRYEFRVDFYEQCQDYIRRTYNLSDSTSVSIFSSPPGSSVYISSGGTTREFDTEAEALEFADNYDPYRSSRRVIPDGYVIFRAEFRERISGVWLNRNVDFVYSGELIELQYLDDTINFYASVLGVSRDDFRYSYSYFPEGGGAEITGEEAEARWPGTGCTPRTSIRIIDEENADNVPDTTYVSLSFEPQIPDTSSITVTVVDGDPTSKELINGDGSITISDAGNITMLNDGGTFFLNEFGNVGFYANGDASLTADNQVQLGVGQNSVTVENGSLTIRDSSGSATLTAAEVNSLKDLLS